MKTILQFFGIFISTVFFLSIEINNQTIFEHIYAVISPTTQTAQKATERFFDRSMNKTQHFSKKFFDNSVPKIKDSVKSKMSASSKKKTNIILDDIQPEDRQELDALIKNHH
jgi:hypothetical protein